MNEDLFTSFIYKSRYAKWLEEENRRENWGETVDRLVDYYSKSVSGHDLPQGWQQEVGKAIYNLEVMPSMRALMSAGPALERCNVAAYNCAYLPVDSLRSFDEAMYILMCGTGVGFSVEKKYVDQLPRIAEQFEPTGTCIKVGDSKEGWAKAYRELVALLFAGQLPTWDVSAVRPAGARLKTFGGRASGPAPLVELFEFSTKVISGASGRRLTSLECHDLMCKVADIVVVGGVRRSAMISLFDCTDDRMSKSKSGAWWEQNSQRRLANNSGVYEHRKPDVGFFMEKWNELYDSKSGEPGLFSRYACQNIAGRNGRRDPNFEFGTNPCSEIILRPFEFCNLTEIVVRSTDTLESLTRKARVASILGTIQSTFTDFKYLRKKWKETCNEERLLGVSLTGVCDNLAVLGRPEVLNALKDVVVETNKEWAGRLGIPQSVATTCVKPSGTVSQRVNSSSGLHTRHSPFYLRTVRADNKDPLTEFLKAKGVYYEADVMDRTGNTSVFYFPIKSPDGAVTRKDMSAIDMLNLWKNLQDNWCEHKPSATINVKDEEWPEVGAWVWNNFDTLSGVALCNEYEFRYERRHKSKDVIQLAFNHLVTLGDRFPQEADGVVFDFNSSGFDTGDVHEDYKLCLINKWDHLDTRRPAWKFRGRPDWYQPK